MYNMEIDEFIQLLEKRDLVASESYNQLIQKFGKDNVMTLSGEDLQIAYEVSDGTIQSWDELIAKIEEYKAKLKEDNETPIFTFSEENSKAIDDFQSQITTLSTALSSIASGDMTDSAIVDLIQQFPELEGKTDNLYEAIQLLIEEALNTLYETLGVEPPPELKNFLENITETAKESVGSLGSSLDKLKSSYSVLEDFKSAMSSDNGFTDSILKSVAALSSELNDMVAGFYSGMVSADELYKALNKHYKTDLQNHAKYLTSKNKNSAAYYKKIGAMDADFINEMAKNYGIDISNCKSYAEAIGKIHSNLVKTLAELWAGFYREQSKVPSTFSSVDGYTQDNRNEANDYLKNKYNSEVEAAKKLAQEAEKRFTDLAEEAANVSFTQSYNKFNESSGSSKASSDTKESKTQINWIDRKLEILAKRLEIIKTKASEIASTFQNQNKWLNEAIKNTKRQIEVYEKAKKSYLKNAENVNLSSSLKSKIRNGSISISSYDSSTAEKIEEYKKWYDAAKEADDMIVQLTLDVGELRKQKVDNIIDDYDRKKSYQEALISYRQAKMGDTGSERDYNYLIQHTNHIKANLQKEYDKVKKQFDTMIKNKEIAKYSDDWYEYKEILVGIKTEIEESTESVVEFKKSIMSLRFDSFTKALETLENLSNEISNVQSLLSGELFDGGTLTKDGIANLTLNFQGMAQTQEKIKAYQGAIDSLSKNLQNGNISQEEYNEKLTEYTKAQKDASLELKSYRDAVINLAVDAINAETEAMKKLVQGKKEALQAEKDLHDYRNSIADKEKNIAVLQTKIAELSNSTDRKDIALRLELEADLEEAQKELSEEQYDHDMQLKQDALDKELEDYEEAQDKKIKDLKTNLESQEKVLDDYLNLVQKNYSSTMDYISKNAATFSYNLTDLLSNPWDEGMSKAQSYKEFIDTVLSDASISSSKIDTTQTDSSNSSSSKVDTSSLKNFGSAAQIGLDVATGNIKNTEHLLEGEGQKIPDSQKVSSLSGTIKSGDSGNKVTVLQKALKALGFNPGTTDGKFGSNTASAVKSFQKNVSKVTGDKLSADGIVNSNTKKKFKLNGYKNGVRNLKEDEL